MTQPSLIDILRAELIDAQRIVATMRPALDKAAKNSAQADADEQAERDDHAVLVAERSKLVTAAGRKRATAIDQGKSVDNEGTYDAIDERLRAAADRVAECEIAAASLREIHVAALNGLRAAETAMRRVEDAILDHEDEELAAEVICIAEVLNQKIDALAARTPSVLDQPINKPYRFPSKKIEAALALRPAADPLNMSVADLRKLGASTSNVEADRAVRRAALHEKMINA